MLGTNCNSEFCNWSKLSIFSRRVIAFLIFHLECSMTADTKKPESFERSEELQARFRRLFRREMTAEEKRILLRDYKFADIARLPRRKR